MPKISKAHGATDGTIDASRAVPKVKPAKPAQAAKATEVRPEGQGQKQDQGQDGEGQKVKDETPVPTIKTTPPDAVKVTAPSRRTR